MALNTVTLTWDLADFLQAVITDQCTISVTPTFLVADTVDNLIIPAVPRSVAFSAGIGSMSGIVANDNGQLTPAGSTYTISVLNRSTGQNIVGPFTAAINRSNGATQDLSFLYQNQSFTYPSFFQYLAAEKNLSEITNAATARTNLGLGPLATAGLSTVQGSLNPQFLSAGTTYSAAVNDLALADCTTGVTVVNLPSAPVNGSTVSVKLLKQNIPSGSVGLYYTTVNTQGIDKFETSTGGTAATLLLLGETATWQYNLTNHVWVRQYGVLPWSQVQANMPSVINVKAFGAVGNGAADDTVAIQAAINAATGSAAPASTTRQPVNPVYFPPGTYKITSDLIIRSVSGFRMMGAGIAQTTINASGSGFTQAAIFIDGSLDGVFEGFALKGDGTEAVGASVLPNGIRLDWTTAASRSTSGNLFRDIRIRSLKASILLSLEGNGSRQLDGTVMQNIVVTGGQTIGSWSNTGPWQTGFAFGNGTYANNYNHVQIGCSAALCYTGWKVSASSLALYGAQPAGNAQDFSLAPGAQCTISNVQSQSCGTFLVTPATYTAIPVSFEDIFIATGAPSLGGNLMIALNGGIWHFKNVVMSNVTVSGTYVNATISVIASGGATRPVTATFDNLTTGGSRVAAFATLTNAYVVVKNFIQFIPSTGTYTVPAVADQLSIYNNSAWSTGGLSTLPNVQFFTSSGTWNKPAGAQTVHVTTVGSGGGGGAGGSGASGTVQCGGGGGAGGAVLTRQFAASDLAGSVAVTVNAGGNGGAAVTGSVGSTTGNAGIAGGNCQFGTLMIAAGGAPGAGGSTTAGAGAGTPYGATGTSSNGSGASASTTGAAGVSVNRSTVPNGQGAPSGGGITSGASASAGAGGNTSSMAGDATAGAAGVVGGATPTSGTASALANGSLGPSPGSGAASTTGAAQAGADALANSGAGGSGGGASLNTFASGKGGNGGSGWVLAITYFQ